MDFIEKLNQQYTVFVLWGTSLPSLFPDLTEQGTALVWAFLWKTSGPIWTSVVVTLVLQIERFVKTKKVDHCVKLKKWHHFQQSQREIAPACSKQHWPSVMFSVLSSAAHWLCTLCVLGCMCTVCVGISIAGGFRLRYAASHVSETLDNADWRRTWCGFCSDGSLFVPRRCVRSSLKLNSRGEKLLKKKEWPAKDSVDKA